LLLRRVILIYDRDILACNSGRWGIYGVKGQYATS